MHNRVKLRQVLVKGFNESELKTLCFDLGVDYDSLPGEHKDDKARELVAYFERRLRISKLAEACARERPEFFLARYPPEDTSERLRVSGISRRH
jgi:hypothetical protein